MFTAYFLQKGLVEELERLFEDSRFPGRDGKMEKLNVFEQYLPILDANVEDADGESPESGLFENIEERMPAPYIQVILTGGKASTTGETGKAEVLLYLCIRDEGTLRNGYQYLLNMVQKILERFQKDSMLNGYRCLGEIPWEIDDADNHPFYFGAMSMVFEISGFGKESAYC